MIYIFTIVITLLIYFLFISKKKQVVIPIFSIAILFLIPSVSIFILSSTVLVLLQIYNNRLIWRNLKMPLLLFTIYVFVFVLSIPEWNQGYQRLLLTLVFRNFLIIAICSIFITNFRDFRIFLLFSLLILFISFILIGFYQYYTGSILASFIKIDDMTYYSASYDLNRLHSFFEMHPANSANGILFVICLTFLNLMNNKLINLSFFFLAVFALILTFTRTSWVVLILTIIVYILLNNGLAKQRTYVYIISATLFILIIYNLFLADIVRESVRLTDSSNLDLRLEFWNYFGNNLSNFISGTGYLNASKSNSIRESSFENYFIQEFVNYGILSLLLYSSIFYIFINNLKNRTTKLMPYKNTILAMMFSFCANMMLATYSEYMLFFVLGLSFAFKNSRKNLLLNQTIEKSKKIKLISSNS